MTRWSIFGVSLSPMHNVGTHIFIYQDRPFQFILFPPLFWHQTRFAAFPGRCKCEYRGFTRQPPSNLRSYNKWSPISEKRKKRKKKRPPLKNNHPEQDKIRGTLVRLLWRAAAPGLKPLRLPHAHLPYPRVKKTKQHTHTNTHHTAKQHSWMNSWMHSRTKSFME